MSGRKVCFPELKGEKMWGHSEEGGKRSTGDRLMWMFGRGRGTCLVARAQLSDRDEKS